MRRTPCTLAHLTGLLVLLAVSAPALAQTAACPASVIQIGPPSSSTLAARETTVVVGSVTLTAAYDLVAGVESVSMTPAGPLEALVRPVDRYRVSGLAPGASADLVIGLAVDGYVYTPGCGGSGCQGWFRASLACGADSVVREVMAGFSGRTDLVETLTLPLHVGEGAEFEVGSSLDIRGRPGSNHGGGGSARLTFAGLPPGASIVSCQGYAIGAVPTARATWGGLKIRYR